MTITLPENIADITLQQFQKLSELLKRTDLDNDQLNRRKIQIFTNLKPDVIQKLKKVDFDEIVNQIDNAINQEAQFTNVFTMNDIQFGFIPNLDKIDISEFADLKKYNTEPEDLHKLMAVLFRPVTDINKKGEYLIEHYRGTDKYSDMMKQTPLNIVNGALFFFLNLSIELTNYTRKYTAEAQAKERQRLTTL
jgi:hypothetical protein